MLLKLFPLLFAFLSAAPASALDLSSWEVKASSPALFSGDFAFSGVLEVRGIELRKEGLFMPAEEFGGKAYRDVKILSKKAYAAVFGALGKGVAKGKAEYSPVPPAWKITGFRKMKGKSRKANADVDFDGDLLVTAGLVLSKREGERYWVAWPRPLVFLDKKLKRAVEQALLDRIEEEGL